MVRDAEGKVYTVRYDAVNAVLLNEFLKEHQVGIRLGNVLSHEAKLGMSSGSSDELRGVITCPCRENT